MPSILQINGWRFFFYANENNEPPHIHVSKGDADCKYWLYPKKFDIKEAYSYNCSLSEKRQIRKIIFEHFDYIISEYNKFHKK